MRMKLKILLPFSVLVNESLVLRVIAETPEGSFGILPLRLDCVAILDAGILLYETQQEGEVFVAVDQGLLVKTGDQILVSVRRAYTGVPLKELNKMINDEFLHLNEQERAMRNVMAKLEAGFLRRSVTLKDNL